MIKLIFHAADLHIRNYQFHDQYRKQFNQMLAEIKRLSEGYTHEEIRIVLAGDLFHEKIKITNEQIIFASWLLTKLTNLGKVIIIPGNHDFMENNPGRVDSITPVVDLLQDENIFYYRESGLFDDENVVWVVYSLYNNNKRPDFEAADKKKLYAGVFHGPITGCKTNIGHVFEDGYDKSIFQGCDIVFCGDIHTRQVLLLEETLEIEQSLLNQYLSEGWEVAENNKIGKVKMNKHVKIIQPGSLIQQNFGETVTEHGFGLYNVEKNAYTFHDLVNNTPYLKFKIMDIKDIETEDEQLLNLK